MQHTERYRQAKKVTLLGALINACLGCIKGAGGILFHSHALVADGIHSFSDLITDAMVLFASKYGSQDADESHPYGHQRIETAATLLLALVLILIGLCIAWDSLEDIFKKAYHPTSWYTLPIAALSILANEGLFHYTRHIGLRIKSDLILANAWHHRSDAAASAVVIVGLMGSLAGFPHLDRVAAIIVGLLIIKMGLEYGWNSVKELVDSALDPQLVSTIEQLILQVEGVSKIHQLRSRMMGPDIFIDVHIQVPPYLSVSEGHFIAQKVHYCLMKQVAQVKDVTVHVDPEDDETNAPSLNLPNRQQLEKNFLAQWRQDYPGIQSWVLHYLDGALTIELICDRHFSQEQALTHRVQTDLQHQPHHTTVYLYLKHHEISLAKSNK